MAASTKVSFSDSKPLQSIWSLLLPPTGISTPWSCSSEISRCDCRCLYSPVALSVQNSYIVTAYGMRFQSGPLADLGRSHLCLLCRCCLMISDFKCVWGILGRYITLFSGPESFASASIFFSLEMTSFLRHHWEESWESIAKSSKCREEARSRQPATIKKLIAGNWWKSSTSFSVFSCKCSSAFCCQSFGTLWQLNVARLFQSNHHHLSKILAWLHSQDIEWSLFPGLTQTIWQYRQTISNDKRMPRNAWSKKKQPGKTKEDQDFQPTRSKRCNLSI